MCNVPVPFIFYMFYPYDSGGPSTIYWSFDAILDSITVRGTGKR